MTQAPGHPSAQTNSDLAQRLATQLAAELRELRKRSGKSLCELERPTLSSDSSLSRYLAGRALPPWPVVEALSEAGIRTSWRGAPDCLVRNDGDVWLWAFGRTAEAVDRVTSAIPGGWSKLEE